MNLLLLINCSLANASLLHAPAEKFNKFVEDLEAAKSMNGNPFPSWLIPPWQQKMQAIEVPQEYPMIAVDDWDLGGAIVFLMSYIQKTNERSTLSAEILEEKARKILATFKLAPVGNAEEWGTGLKEHALRLKEKVPKLMDWIDREKMTLVKTNDPSYLLVRNPLISPIPVQQIQFIIRGGLPLCKEKMAKEYLPTSLWSLLEIARKKNRVLPNFQFSLDLHLHLVDSAPFEKASLLELLHLIPTGEPFSLGVVSLDADEINPKNAMVYDLLMAEDHVIYGLLYSQTSVMAFSLPQAQLAAFVDQLHFLPSDFTKVPELQMQPVTLSWYPPTQQ